jgi:DNA (cytosine-5)-methyltransferase 1
MGTKPLQPRSHHDGVNRSRPTKNAPSPVPALDVFAGAGGLSRGITLAGFKPVGAVEVMADAAATYEAHHNIEVDRRRLEKIPEAELRAWATDVRVIVAGPPCQPWSTGGRRLASRDSRDGFPALLRTLEVIRPEAFLIENVAGLERGITRPYFLTLVHRLEELGYDVVAKTLDAADYGVPQHRRRLFLVGVRGGHFSFPEPTHGPGRAKPWATAGEVLGRNPVGEPNESIITYAKRPHIRPSPYDGLLFNGGGRPINLQAPARTILSSAGGNKTPFLDLDGHVPEYHARLWDEETGRPRRDYRRRVRRGRLRNARRLTVEECAALQSLPAEMKFSGTRSIRYTLVGNAVPPKLASAVASALRKAL